MSPGLPKLAFVCVFAVNCILWSHSRYAQVVPSSSLDVPNALSRRSLAGLLYRSADDHEEDECAPLTFPPDDQCRHVREVCPTSPTFLSIPYLESYFCAAPSVRPAIFTGLIVWLIFLFSTLGISASDFFCPNLATIAELLGLDENVAGVTFLAFGNGSPDVFSTYSAMRADSGSLAIGELLGAASFIVSCVAGSICIIKPFKVERAPFLRDVGFFTAAVTLLLVILRDGKIRAWEAASLIALYVLYVGTVVVGSWWERRKHRRHQREAMIRGEYADDETPQSSLFEGERYQDDPISSTTTLVPPSPKRVRAHSSPGPPRLGIDTQVPLRPHSRSPSPVSTPRTSMPSFSLVGALEFRHVISSLQRQSSTSNLSVFENPAAPYAGGHYHRHSLPRPRSPRLATHDHEVDPWDAALGVPLNRRSPRLEVTSTLTDDTLSRPSSLMPNGGEDGLGPRASIPRISHTPASPVSEESVDVELQPSAPPNLRQRVTRTIEHIYHVLFPTLHDFRSKSVLGMIASVLAAPAVLALTITLPVVVTPRGGPAPEEKNHAPEGRLVEFEEEGVERMLTAEEEVQEDIHELKFNKWLMTAQCALGPLFCVAVLFAGAKHEIWLLLATGGVGMVAAVLVSIFSDRGNDANARMARCFMGFVVAVIWIMAIADEVVNVLKTFGFIFGLSDAIIGLTIFAVGNSLADFVADISVAAFAPIMGFSACFGGPMLNILLGVGISGSYIIQQTQHEFTLHFSTTLLVSTVGLLVLLCATLVFVPWNGYLLTRRWGIFLIVSYIIIMVTNLIVEIQGS